LKINYTQSGHIFIGPEDDPQAIARAMAETGYENEFCIADDFAPDFIARLMAAGFLVMSLRLNGHGGDHGPPVYILTPKLHFERSVIFFDDFHEPRSARRLIPRYKLRADMGTGAPSDFSLFDSVMERCAAIHGDDWLTPPLRETFRQIHASRNTAVHTAAFGLYREGRLAAGEFGVVAGKVYTSYSGYYEEDSAGTVQLILTGRYLRDAGFAFWDLGMPMDYKTRLGAHGVERGEFLEMVGKNLIYRYAGKSA
jgi:Leu/Phe-tRNA-protein transferase